MNKFVIALAAIGCLSVPALAAAPSEKPIVMAQMGSGEPGRDRDPGYGPGYDRDRGPGYDRDRGPGYGRDRGPGYDRDRGPGYDRDRGPGYRDRDAGYAPPPRCRWWRDSYGEVHRSCRGY